AGCSFETIDNGDSDDTDTSKDVEENGSNHTEDDQDKDAETKESDEAADDQEHDGAENEQETNAEAENERDSESEDEVLEFADALRKTNDIIKNDGISKLDDSKQYTFAGNYETNGLTDIACDHVD